MGTFGWDDPAGYTETERLWRDAAYDLEDRELFGPPEEVAQLGLDCGHCCLDCCDCLEPEMEVT